jgi:hypothetical protein
MNIALPPEIIANVTSANRRHYRLPRHNLRPWAWVFILFSLFTAGITIPAFIPFQNVFFPLLSPIDFLFFLFGMFPLLSFLLFSVVLALTGLWFYSGHFEIELRNNSLISIFRLGPLQFSERRSLQGLQQFTVIRSNPSDGGSLLLAEWASGKKWVLAFGYPRRLMLPLANELSQYCQLQQLKSFSQPNALVLRVIEESVDPEEILERPEQPAESTAILERCLDGVTITLPVLGLRRVWGSFLGMFTLGWNGFMAMFSAIFLSALLADQVEENAWWFCWIMLPLMWLIGIGLLLETLHMSKRSAVLTVTKDSLAILETELFGKRHHKWFRRDLENVGVVSESWKDSDGDTCWTIALNIQPKKGKPYKLLDWQDKAELEWIATVLRQALNLQFKQFSSVGQRLSPRKPPSPISRWANRVLTIILLLGMGVGWEIREGVNKAGETAILKNGPIFLWHDAPEAADTPEAKHYISIKIRRWYVYGAYQSSSSYGE